MYESNEMAFWKRQTCGDSKKIDGCQGLEKKEGWTGRAQRIWRSETILYGPRGWGQVILCLSKPKISHRELTLT